MFISQIPFLLLLFLLVHCDDYTCSESATLRAVTTQCSAVTWSVARIINHNLTNESDYYPVVLDFDEQEKRVSDLYHYYQENLTMSIQCKGKLLDFACAEVYPKCAYSYPYTAYWTICRSDCEVLQNKCGPIPQLDCSKFKNDTFECYRLVSNSQFVMTYTSSDKNAIYVYTISLVLSALLFAGWLILYIRYYTQSTSLHTFLTALFLMKTISDIVTLFVYQDVSNNQGIGSNNGGIIVVCFQLLYDTLFYFVMFVIAKGWCILYSSLLLSEWIRYYCLAILFYCVDGLLLVFAIEQITPTLFHLLCLILYGLIIFDLLFSSNYAMFKTRIKMERMYRDGLNPYKHPTYFKYLTFYLVNLIILLKSCCILIRHIIFPLLGFDSNRTAIALLSLISEFLVLFCLAILYRPQMESSIYLSSSADDSDYFVIVSVILTKYLKEGDCIVNAKECIILFPGEDNYAYGQQTLHIADELKEQEKPTQTEEKQSS